MYSKLKMLLALQEQDFKLDFALRRIDFVMVIETFR